MAAATKRPVNVNVGVLGHVDSGKTNLVRVLSTQLSTAALDKHPQSQQRGITLDLGFSAFRLPVRSTDGDDDGHNSHGSHANNDISANTTQPTNTQEIQVTLVDCPGHASLFKTILGGARIIDMVLLVVDVTKGLQPQTIESLIVAELAVEHHIVVALNKIDLVPQRERVARVQHVQTTIRAFLRRHFARFRDRSVPIVPVAATPGVSSASSTGTDPAAVTALGISELVDALRRHMHVPTRDASGAFSVAIDHCFAIGGSGTILTGTVLSGVVRVGDALELPSLQVVKTVKSLQVFRTSVASAAQGDRVGIRVNGLDASLVERGVGIAPRSLAFATQLIVPVHQIAFFQGARCKSGARLHATIGHTTVVAIATFFTRLGGDTSAGAELFDPAALYEHVAQLEPLASCRDEGDDANTASAPSAAREPRANCFALLQLEQPVLCPRGALVVGSRLDLDPKKFACRLVFHGRVAAVVTASSGGSGAPGGTSDSNSDTNSNAPPSVSLASLRIGRIKSRDGVVDKVMRSSGGSGDGGTCEVLGREMFAKDVDWRVYIGVRVLFADSCTLGRVLGPFGKAGKFRIEVLGAQPPVPGERIVLRFVKITHLRASGAAAATVTIVGSTNASNGVRAKVARNLVQDDALLYPEAFAAGTNTATTVESLGVPAPTETVDECGPSWRSLTPTGSLLEQPCGYIERLKGETTPDGRNPLAIVAGLFASDTDAARAVGKRVVVVHTDITRTYTEPNNLSDVGEIEKPFGKAGKVRVSFHSHGGTCAREGDSVALCE